MPTWKLPFALSKLPFALVAIAGLGTGCATDRATLLGHTSQADAGGERLPHYGEGVPKRPAAAARWFRGEAERGVPEAQFNLGVMYSRGEGVERDPTEAVRWLRSAESRGIRQAPAQLGALYAVGEAADATPAEAERWLLAAAHAGSPGARTALGERYASLDPSPPKSAPARETQPPPLPTPAVEETPEELLAAGDRHRNADGVPRDLPYSAVLYTRAAEAGLPEAQARLGDAYREGIGVPRDYVLAYKWLSLAAAAGADGARASLDKTEERLTTERILEAQAMAREWYDRHLDASGEIER